MTALGKELGVWSLGLELEGFRVSDFCGIKGSYYDIPKAVFYFLKGDYRVQRLGLWSCEGSAWVGLRLRIQSLGFRISNLDEVLG